MNFLSNWFRPSASAGSLSTTDVVKSLGTGITLAGTLTLIAHLIQGVAPVLSNDFPTEAAIISAVSAIAVDLLQRFAGTSE